MTYGVFYEIAAILGLGTMLGILGQKLRQPLIIMFLAAGILAGPSVSGILRSQEEIGLLAQMGIALLLFMVGLKLDLKLIRMTGPVALATGLGQIVFTSVIGFFIALATGMNALGSSYVAVALTFSSTIIIVKLLSDKNEIDSLHGQIAVGFLIVQDIAAILALVGLTTLGARVPGEESLLAVTSMITLKGVGLLACVFLMTRYVFPRLMRRLARSQEMITLFAIAWAVVLSAGSELLGFSKEVGAFLAGLSLASTEYREAIGARLTTLRDFLLLFFFIDLGARLDWSVMGSQFGKSFLFSVFVLVGNPIIMLAIMGWMGYRRRTAFMVGLTVAQISEFSLILMALGLSLGHVSAEVVGMITLVGVVTIFASTYLILYSDPLYRAFSAPLKIFERKNPYRESSVASFRDTSAVDVILVGLGRYGSGLAEDLLRRKKTIIGVDFDPGALERWRSRGIGVLYGDMADPDIHEQLPLDKAKWVVSTVRLKEINLAMIHLLKSRGYKDKVALTATNAEEAALYEKTGADVVFRPFRDAAEQAADSLTHAMDVLQENIDWPIALREVRIRTGSAFAGQTVRDIPLRAATGVSILAVSRAGRVHYDPGADFQIYPGDRLVIVGSPEELRHAERMLDELQDVEAGNDPEPFSIVEVEVPHDFGSSHRTLVDLRFRQKYGATVVGISRGEQKITAPGPREELKPGDRLIVIGTAKALEMLKIQGLSGVEPAG